MIWEAQVCLRLSGLKQNLYQSVHGAGREIRHNYNVSSQSHVSLFSDDNYCISMVSGQATKMESVFSVRWP